MHQRSSTAQRYAKHSIRWRIYVLKLLNIISSFDYALLAYHRGSERLYEAQGRYFTQSMTPHLQIRLYANGYMSRRFHDTAGCLDCRYVWTYVPLERPTMGARATHHRRCQGLGSRGISMSQEPHQLRLDLCILIISRISQLHHISINDEAPGRTGNRIALVAEKTRELVL